VSGRIPEAVAAIIIDLILINEICTVNIVVDIYGIVYFAKYDTIA
jgi:hypothetical protein